MDLPVSKAVESDAKDVRIDNAANTTTGQGGPGLLETLLAKLKGLKLKKPFDHAGDYASNPDRDDN